MKFFLIFLIALMCLQSCASKGTDIQQLLTFVREYRHEVFPDMDEKDSLFYLVLFYHKDGKDEILLNANNLEIPNVVGTPQSPNGENSYDPFCGYAEYNNNFLFFYKSEDSNLADGVIKEIPLKQRIEENYPLSQYKTSEWYIDSESWIIYSKDGILYRKKK